MGKCKGIIFFRNNIAEYKIKTVAAFVSRQYTVRSSEFKRKDLMKYAACDKSAKPRFA